MAGFHTWRTVGRYVRKGEKGIAILAPIVRRRRDDDDDESRAIVGFRTAYVFDVAQTDGAPLPEVADVTGDPGDHTVALKAAVGANTRAFDGKSPRPFSGRSVLRLRHLAFHHLLTGSLVPRLPPASRFSLFIASRWMSGPRSR